MTPDQLRDLQARLDRDADPGKRDWWTRYLKGEARFRGTPMPTVRHHVHEWWESHDFDGLPATDRMEVPLRLLREPMTEDKLAGMLLLGERFVPGGWLDADRDLSAMASLFDDGHLADWNAVDWFCVKVLGPWVAGLEGPAADSPRAALGRAISSWHSAPGLWRRRAAAVAFVNLVKEGDDVFDGLIDEVLRTCEVLVRDEARFSQTGAGWVLRELSVAVPERVSAFLDQNRQLMSSEALRSARRKLDA